jgi:hypothetical protein
MMTYAEKIERDREAPARASDQQGARLPTCQWMITGELRGEGIGHTSTLRHCGRLDRGFGEEGF